MRRSMYIPATNEERDPERLVELMARHPFATVMTPAPAGLCISHVPLLVRRRGGAIFTSAAPCVNDSPEPAEARVHELAAGFEPDATAWNSASLPADLVQRLSRAIVAFELRAERIEGKLKLGQNRSAADREGAIAHLEAAGDDAARALAAMMRATLE